MNVTASDPMPTAKLQIQKKEPQRNGNITGGDYREIALKGAHPRSGAIRNTELKVIDTNTVACYSKS